MFKTQISTVSESNVKGCTAAYKTCISLYHEVFKNLKLADLQTIIDTCGKNYPTLRKIKVLFNQLYDFAIKNDICNKDYSTFVDVVQSRIVIRISMTETNLRRVKSNGYRSRKVPIADKVLPFYKA